MRRSPGAWRAAVPPLVLVGLILVSAAVAATPEGPTAHTGPHATWTSPGALIADGTITGTCDLAEARWLDTVDLTLTGQRIHIERITTWTRETTTLDPRQPDTPGTAVEPEHSTEQAYESWTTTGPVHVRADDGTAILLGTAAQQAIRGPIHALAVAEDTEPFLTFRPVVDGPRQTITTEAGHQTTSGHAHRAIGPSDAPIHGDARLHLRNVELTAPEVQHATQTWGHVEAVTRAEPLGTRTTRVYEELRIHITDGTVTTGHPTDTRSCTGLTLDIDGTLSATDTTGHATLADTTVTLDHDTLTLQGRLRYSETVTEHPDSTTRADSEADGDIVLIATQGTIRTIDPQAWHDWATPAAVAATGVGILAIIGFALYSRIAHDAVLDHPKRAMLHDYVDANPGCTLADASRDLEVARTVLEHHLQKLEAAGQVRRVELDGVRMLVPPTLGETGTGRLLEERHEPLQHLRLVLTAGPMLRSRLVQRLMDDLRLSERSARRWIKKAIEHDLAESEGRGKGVTIRCRAN